METCRNLFAFSLSFVHCFVIWIEIIGNADDWWLTNIVVWYLFVCFVCFVVVWFKGFRFVRRTTCLRKNLLNHSIFDMNKQFHFWIFYISFLSCLSLPLSLFLLVYLLHLNDSSWWIFFPFISFHGAIQQNNCRILLNWVYLPNAKILPKRTHRSLLCGCCGRWCFNEYCFSIFNNGNFCVFIEIDSKLIEISCLFRFFFFISFLIVCDHFSIFTRST